MMTVILVVDFYNLMISIQIYTNIMSYICLFNYLKFCNKINQLIINYYTKVLILIKKGYRWSVYIYV